MKPLSIVFLCLLCICILSVCVFSAALERTADQVAFQEKVYAGTSDAAKGLSFRLETDHEDYLYWDCRYTVGGSLEIKEAFRAGTKEDYLRPFYEEYPGVILYDDAGFNYTRYYNIHSGNLHGLAKAWSELYKQTSNENGEKLIRIKDYCEYYPLKLELITDCGTNASYTSIYATDDYACTVTKEFNDYFRIPVLEDDHLKIGYHMMEGSNSYPGTGSHNHFDFTSVGIVKDQNAYFTFIPRTDQGTLVDTSLIPGGYGIYAVDIEINAVGWKCVSSGTLRTVCSLDPALTVCQIRTDSTGKLLHVFAWDPDQNLLLLTFDIASGQELHRETLLQSKMSGNHTVSYFVGQGCDLLYVDRSEYLVLTEESDGTLRHHMTLKRDENQQPEITLQPCNISFDGQRLAIVYNSQQLNFREDELNGYNRWDERPAGEVFVSVYDQTGLIYSAAFSHTLESVTTEPALYGGAQLSVSWNNSAD